MKNVKYFIIYNKFRKHNNIYNHNHILVTNKMQFKENLNYR